MKSACRWIGVKAVVTGVVLCLSLSCETGTATEATDYSIASHWLAVPTATNKAVDVFYLYPTSWTSTNPNPEVCAIDNPSMLAKAPINFAKQAPAFEPIGNIYAPFYRQSNLTTNAPVVVAGTPTLDAMAAFDYYIQHFNQGRSFILAGHSQGANALSNLLAQYLKANPAVLARMIAAYVIGYPVTAQYLADNPCLKFATGPGDTGVIISYNTQAPGFPPSANPILWGLVGTVINPITWTRAETVATPSQGFGSFMPTSNGVYVGGPQYADARINITSGVLICSTADTNALAAFDGLASIGVYHNFDYPFYFFNIRSNAATRTRNYLNKVGSDYDADGKADPAVYDPVSGPYTVFLSASGYAPTVVIMGQPSSASSLQPIPGDFDGDGKADPAVYDPIASQLRVQLSSLSYGLNTMSIGESSCVPASGDFDGDGKADPALYSAAAGRFTAWLSGSGYAASILSCGGAGWSNASGDYDGDSKTDPALYEAATGTWQVFMSSLGYAPAYGATVGGAGVVPAPGDYDGDGKFDLMVYQAASGLWLCALSGQGYATSGLSGLAGPSMIPRPGDYDNDGKADPALYDSTAHTFYVWLSGSNFGLASLSW